MSRSLLASLTLCGLSLASAPARADLARRRGPIVEVVQKVGAAVVFIGTEQVVDRKLRGSALEDFFGEEFGRDRRQAVQSLGSGVIIEPTGLIVTNEHVIRGASAIHVVLADGRQLEAEVVGSDASNDLAVLKVAAKGPLPAAKLGTSADLMIGETVIAIGSPYGLAKTVTSGVISAVGRSLKAEDHVYNDFIQTDAAINPGNSGGPLLNVDGEIIGINSAIFAPAQGIGFAIPADKIRRIVLELKNFGKVRPAWVGVNAVPLSGQLARQIGWDRNYGVLVGSVDPGSPAATSGILRGDVVAEVAGTPVQDVEDFEVRLRAYPARASVSLTVLRNGKPRTLSVTPVPYTPELADSLAWERLGLRVAPGRRGLAVTSVRPGSQADQIGIVSGDVLSRLNNQPLDSLERFRDGLVASRSTRGVVLSVRRRGVTYPVSFRL